MNRKKRVAIIGTNGLPANYGGYETLAEYLTLELGSKFDFVVYCSSIYKKSQRLKSYNNARLIYLPLKANGYQSIIYDIICTIHAWFTSDTLLVLGPAAGFILPFTKLFGRNLIVNHGGLNEWEREKFSSIERYWAKINHKLSARAARINIADNQQLKESIKKTFGADSTVIRYGGDHAQKKEITNDLLVKYPFLNDQYAVSISRAQVDNNLLMVLEAFEKQNNYKLVLISNWNVSDYGRKLFDKYYSTSNLILLNAIYNIDEVNAIRSNARIYIHSHSRCGTAPSLVEAMHLRLPIICYDIPTNRETTHNKAWYFKDSTELSNILSNSSRKDFSDLGIILYDIAANNYSWKKIAGEYEQLF